ncbi:hypothetical protein D3C81_1389890 [compost metagenome]
MSRGDTRVSTNSWSPSGTITIACPFGGTTPPMVVTSTSFTTPRTGERSVNRVNESARPRTTEDSDSTSAFALASSSRLRTMYSERTSAIFKRNSELCRCRRSSSTLLAAPVASSDSVICSSRLTRSSERCSPPCDSAKLARRDRNNALSLAISSGCAVTSSSGKCKAVAPSTSACRRIELANAARYLAAVSSTLDSPRVGSSCAST